MSTLRGSVTAGEYIFFIDATLAWDRLRIAAKEEKNRLASFADIFPF